MDITQYYEQNDPEEYIMDLEQINAIRQYDKTVDIVGISGDLDSMNKDYFKFTLRNNMGHKIQVLAWSDTRSYVESLIKSDAIIHLDGVYVQSKYPNSKSTIPFDLIVKTNSKISLLKLLNSKLQNNANTVTPYFRLEDAVNDDSIIEITCYLQQTIGEIISNKNEKYYQGCITDLEKKLILRFQDKPSSPIGVGDYIKIVGRIIDNGHGNYYLSGNEVSIIEKGKKHFFDLMDISSNAKRKLENNDQQNVEKKTKMD